MRVAYLVIAHHLPDQLARLVAHLRRAGDVYIHLDRKARDRFHGLEGCHVLSERLDVWWGGWSIVAAELALARAALPGCYDYYSHLTGQCYPIKPLAAFHAFLEANHPAEHMVYADVATQWPAAVGRFDKHYLERRTLVNRAVNRILRRVPYRRKVPAGLIPKSGWQNWTLTHGALEYLTRAFRDRPELAGYFRLGMNVCETALQTVFASSPFQGRVNPRSTHEIEFPPGSPHPRIWTQADLPRLLASPAFFARKFDVRVDRDTLDNLDTIFAPIVRSPKEPSSE